MKTAPAPTPKTDLMFVCATVIMALGLGFMLITTHILDSIADLWPILTGLTGVLMSYFVFTRHGRVKFLFASLFLFFASSLNLVSLVFSVELRILWPIYMILAGIAIFTAGHVRYRRFLPGFTVPGSAFLALGFLFCVFSFGFSSMRFRVFLSIWWPGFLLAGGILLFIVYFMSRSAAKSRSTESDEQK